MGLSRDQVEQLRVKLKAAPKAPAASVDTTKQEAVKLLAREIEGLQKRGYSLEQIVEMLKGGGLVLSTPTLKSYLSRAKVARQRGSQGRTKKAAGGAHAPPAAVVGPEINAPDARGERSTEARPRIPAGGKRASAVTAADAAAGRPTTASGKTPETMTPTAEAVQLRSGKDAFLITDMDSY